MTIDDHSTRPLPGQPGYTIDAVISVDLDQSRPGTVVENPDGRADVLEVVTTRGDQDIPVRGAAVDTRHLYHQGLGHPGLPGVRRTRTALVLRDLIPYRTRPVAPAGGAVDGSPT